MCVWQLKRCKQQGRGLEGLLEVREDEQVMEIV